MVNPGVPIYSDRLETKSVKRTFQVAVAVTVAVAVFCWGGQQSLGLRPASSLDYVKCKPFREQAKPH